MACAQRTGGGAVFFSLLVNRHLLSPPCLPAPRTVALHPKRCCSPCLLCVLRNYLQAQPCEHSLFLKQRFAAHYSTATCRQRVLAVNRLPIRAALRAHTTAHSPLTAPATASSAHHAFLPALRVWYGARARIYVSWHYMARQGQTRRLVCSISYSAVHISFCGVSQNCMSLCFILSGSLGTINTLFSTGI